jgi:hypothetical protein
VQQTRVGALHLNVAEQWWIRAQGRKRSHPRFGSAVQLQTGMETRWMRSNGQGQQQQLVTLRQMMREVGLRSKRGLKTRLGKHNKQT